MLGNWSSWEKEAENYFNIVLPKLKIGSATASPTEQQLMSQIQKLADPLQWGALKKICRWLYALENVSDADEMVEILNSHAALLPTSIVSMGLWDIEERRQKTLSETIQEIEVLLATGQYKQATAVYETIRTAYSENDYLTRCEYYRSFDQRKQNTASLKIELDTLFRVNDFHGADDLYTRTPNILTRDEYDFLKSEYLYDYLPGAFNMPVNDEQALAVAASGKRILLSARARSGKTRVIALKAALLMLKHNVRADEIMILAFNNTVAKEICDRIQNSLSLPEFSQAWTFHKLAYNLLQPEAAILYDDPDPLADPALSNQIRTILHSRLTEDFQADLYQVFRQEYRIDRQDFPEMKNSKYYHFRRSVRQITLNGERVKSTAEKYIADFCFEHGISYQYERLVRWENRNYRPDFTILNPDKSVKAVLEHWGFDDDDFEPRKNWTKSPSVYHEEKERKRQHWQSQGIPLIETSPIDMKNGRERFERHLQKCFQQTGILCQKLDLPELYQKVNVRHQDNIVKMFLQFLQRAKQMNLDAQALFVKIRAHQSTSTRAAIFWKRAYEIHTAYTDLMNIGEQTDFNKILQDAAALIVSTDGRCHITDGSRHTPVCHIKYLLIDEYQDFSPLFSGLVNAFISVNPSISIFCVGDDWQAINTYAGSDLNFFRKFEKDHTDAQLLYLIQNHRSAPELIQVSNSLMFGKGPAAEAANTHLQGSVHICHIDKVFVKMRRNAQQESVIADKRFIWPEADSGWMKSRYLKKCYQIINAHRGKTVTLLCRNNHFHSTSLKDFYYQLRKCFIVNGQVSSGFDDRVQYSSIHRYKGREADVVILLDACKNRFPIIHHTQEFMGLFGTTAEDVFDEERRLFYVALSRAKQTLWILTETEYASPFLSEIEIPEPTPSLVGSSLSQLLNPELINAMRNNQTAD